MNKLTLNLAIFILIINFLSLEIAYAKTAIATCPYSSSIYKIKDTNGVFTGTFTASGGWHSSSDFAAMYRGQPTEFPRKIDFISADLYKNSTSCIYAADGAMLYLSSPLKFNHYGLHWFSGGYALDDGAFEAFHCGRFPGQDDIHINENYCQFLPRE